MESSGYVDQDLRQQYREQLHDKIAEAVARRRSSVSDSPHGEDSPTKSLMTPLTPFELRAPPPTPATTIATMAETPTNHAPPSIPVTMGSGRSQLAPARLEFEEDGIAPGCGQMKLLSRALDASDRKPNLITTASATQIRANESNKENVANILEAEAPLVWDGHSPVESPKDPSIPVHDKDRRRSSVSSYGSDSEASPTRKRCSLGTQERELEDRWREVELKKRFVMEKEMELDQTLQAEKSALEKSRAQLLLYEEEVQKHEAQLKEKEAELLPKLQKSCRSRIWNFLCGLLRLTVFHMLLNVIHLHEVPGLEMPKIMVAYSSFVVQWPTSEVGSIEISGDKTLVAKMALEESPKVQCECPASNPCPDCPMADPCPVQYECPASNPCPVCPVAAPCPVPDQCPVPAQRSHVSTSVIRFQVPWFVDRNHTATSVSDQGCLPAEARNAHLAFDWSSDRVRFLQSEVDRLHAKIKQQKIQRREEQTQSHQQPQPQQQPQTRPDPKEEPAASAAILSSEPKSKSESCTEDPKQAAEQAAPTSWKIGAVISAIIGAFGGCCVPKLVASLL